MIEIFLLKIDERISDDRINTMLDCIPGSRNAMLKRFVGKKDLLRGLYSSILIRYLVHKKLNISSEKIRFILNEYQKPFLAGCDNFNFNISHSGDYVACALSGSMIGIDIQQMRNNCFDIAETVFAEEELEKFRMLPETEKPDFFFDLWTLKESYIKAVGLGLSLDLKSFYFNIIDNSIKLISPHKYPCNNFKMYYVDKSYKCAVCAEQNLFPDEIKKLRIDEIAEEIL